MQLRWILLLLVLPAAALAQANGDSLQTALDAVTRRQRDLTLPARPSGYYALSQYRHQAQPADADDIAFLDTGRDFNGYGQPENIGAGYQKTISSGAAPYPAVLSDVPVQPPPNQLENVLLDYMKDVYVKDDNDDGEANYYQYGMDTDAKRSLFRERENDDNGQDVEYHQLLPTYYDSENKQESILLPTLFRERFHSRPDIEQDVDMDKMRRYATKALEKQLETDEEEKLENKRSSDEEEEYLSLLRNLWQKYKEAKPQLLDFDDLTQNDIQEIVSSLRNDRSSLHKRQYGYGAGFDIFNNAGVMGQWGSGSSNFVKRNKQRVEGNGQQGANFLYSLKFVSPEVNREAVETLTDNEGIELPDERDEDILHLASGFARNNPEDLMQIYGRPSSIDGIYSPNQETYQTLSLETPEIGSRATSNKHMSSFARDVNEYQQLSPANYMVIPDRTSNKRFIYEAKRKRYPVTKRSSNFYASPPMLHHKSFNSEGIKDTNKKKSSPITGVTDPKVAQELNQIFSSVTHDDSSKDNEKQANSETNGKLTTSKDTKDPNHETTTTHSVTTVNVQENTQNNDTETNANSAHNRTSGSGEEDNHKSHTHGTSLHMEKETAEPITMSKIQTPLEIKKKSIDLSDYFGIDRRRKKTAPENIETKDGDSNMIDDNWLLNQYYRTLAMVSNPLKKRMVPHNHAHSPNNNDNKRDVGKPQAYNTDIFSRSSQRETAKKSLNSKEDTSIDDMDSKLRNMEDLIVNEAVKYTGSHEGTQDPKEIQEMKDKIMSRLAAAYSLEKMRLALSEFKSSLQAQMMSKYNPANLKSSLSDSNAQEESKMKRVAVKKEKAEDEKHVDDGDKKKRNGNKNDAEEETSGEFLDGPVDVEPMSEGYMGKSIDDYETGCPVLDQILQRCRNIGYASEDHNQVFLSLCSLHQICNICGPDVGAPSSSACDLMFITEADSICEEEIKCQRVSHRILTFMHRGHPMGIVGTSTDHCSNDSCLAQYFLTSPLPNNQPR